MDTKTVFRSLEATAITLGVPLKYLRQLADEGRVPCLRVGKRRLFDPGAVKAALDVQATPAPDKAAEALRRIDEIIRACQGDAVRVVDDDAADAEGGRS